MDSVCSQIKNELETNYDIPFDVKFRQEYNDPHFILAPGNDIGELFEVNIAVRQDIRLIIEITPQKYAADMIKDMNLATEEKRDLFRKYLTLFSADNAKVDIRVNHSLCDLLQDEIWDCEWKNFRIRISKVLAGAFESPDIKQEVPRWASHSVGMMMALLNVEVMTRDEQYLEGKRSQITLNRYERNPANRELCLAYNGYVCKICGFDFEKKYGTIGHGFIHVHHIESIASHENEYYLDPKTDLIPVCPNCHAMLHRSNPPMVPEALKEIIQRIKGE